MFEDFIAASSEEHARSFMRQLEGPGFNLIPDEQWQPFCNAWAECINLMELAFKKTNLGLLSAARWGSLLAALSHCPLKSLDLSQNNFSTLSNDALKEIGMGLANCVEIRQLDISNTSLHKISNEGLEIFFEGLSKCTKLKKLIISSTELGKCSAQQAKTISIALAKFKTLQDIRLPAAMDGWTLNIKHWKRVSSCFANCGQIRHILNIDELTPEITKVLYASPTSPFIVNTQGWGGYYPLPSEATSQKNRAILLAWHASVFSYLRKPLAGINIPIDAVQIIMSFYAGVDQKIIKHLLTECGEVAKVKEVKKEKKALSDFNSFNEFMNHTLLNNNVGLQTGVEGIKETAEAEKTNEVKQVEEKKNPLTFMSFAEYKTKAVELANNNNPARVIRYEPLAWDLTSKKLIAKARLDLELQSNMQTTLAKDKQQSKSKVKEFSFSLFSNCMR